MGNVSARTPTKMNITALRGRLSSRNRTGTFAPIRAPGTDLSGRRQETVRPNLGRDSILDHELIRVGRVHVTMPEEVLFETERRMDRNEIAAYFRTVAEKLESGQDLTLSAGDQSVT